MLWLSGLEKKQKSIKQVPQSDTTTQWAEGGVHCVAATTAISSYFYFLFYHFPPVLNHNLPHDSFYRLNMSQLLLITRPWHLSEFNISTSLQEKQPCHCFNPGCAASAFPGVLIVVLKMFHDPFLSRLVFIVFSSGCGTNIKPKLNLLLLLFSNLIRKSEKWHLTTSNVCSLITFFSLQIIYRYVSFTADVKSCAWHTESSHNIMTGSMCSPGKKQSLFSRGSHLWMHF